MQGNDVSMSKSDLNVLINEKDDSGISNEAPLASLENCLNNLENEKKDGKGITLKTFAEEIYNIAERYKYIFHYKPKKIKSHESFLSILIFNLKENKYFEILKQFENDSEKELILILNLVYNNNILSFFKDFYKKDCDKKIYKESSIIVDERNKILLLTTKLTLILDQHKKLLNAQKFTQFKEIIINLNNQIEHSYLIQDKKKSQYKKSLELSPIKKSSLKLTARFSNLLSFQDEFIMRERSLNKSPSFMLDENPHEDNHLFKRISVIKPDFQRNNILTKLNTRNSFYNEYLPLLVNENDEKLEIDFKSNNFYEKKYLVVFQEKPNIFAQNDKIVIRDISNNLRMVHLTNSKLFYLNNYFKKQKFYDFNLNFKKNIPFEKLGDTYICGDCGRKITDFKKIPCNLIFWCSYSMNYVCSECFDNDFSILPSFILNYWDFSKFPISRKSKEILNSWYSEPIIRIKSKFDCLRISSELKSVLILKNKIVTIFDLMKCKNSEEFVKTTLGVNLRHFALRENIFSLKNLYDIEYNSGLQEVEEIFNQFEKHVISDCGECRLEGKICDVCKDEEILFIYNVHEVFYCKHCLSLTHKKCSMAHPCLIEK